MRKNLYLAGALSAVAVLAGCQSTGPFSPRANVQPKAAVGPETNLTPKPLAAISGKWIPTDEGAKGVYVAEFRDGVFVSRSPTTRKPLAKGSYKIVTPKKVDLKFVGAATKTAVEAKCDLQTETTMYCVPTVGSPFNLRRA